MGGLRWPSGDTPAGGRWSSSCSLLRKREKGAGPPARASPAGRGRSALTPTCSQNTPPEHVSSHGYKNAYFSLAQRCLEQFQASADLREPIARAPTQPCRAWWGGSPHRGRRSEGRGAWPPPEKPALSCSQASERLSEPTNKRSS